MDLVPADKLVGRSCLDRREYLGRLSHVTSGKMGDISKRTVCQIMTRGSSRRGALSRGEKPQVLGQTACADQYWDPTGVFRGGRRLKRPTAIAQSDSWGALHVCFVATGLPNEISW